MITDTRSKLGDLSALVKTDSPPKVLWVVQREPLRVAGKDTFVTEMIELAGGQNALSSTIHQYPPIGPEQVIACRPDVIIEPSMLPGQLEGQRKTALKYWSKSQFKNIPAVVNGRIYVIDGDLVSRLGSRFYQGVEKIARCMHPQLFQAEK
jgi:iron complex transport system substrate-binding protein